MPDQQPWMHALRFACQQGSQAGVASILGCGASTLSQVLSGTYPADTAPIQRRVELALMGVVVQCPMLGQIQGKQCMLWQLKPHAITNPLRSQMYQACHHSGCVNQCVEGKR